MTPLFAAGQRETTEPESNSPISTDTHPADISEYMRRDDAMRVAGQIVKGVFWSAEGWLGIDDPVLLKQSAQKGDEVLLDCEWPALTIEEELVVAKSTPQSRHELAAESAAEDFDG